MSGDIDDYSVLSERIAVRTGTRDADSFPETLYHYTSSQSFLGIVESGEIWLSDFRYMNDVSELNYGFNLFASEIASRLDDQRCYGEEKRLLSLLLEQLEKARVYTDVFVFSMCEQDNLLNQWRVYGRDAVPVSMGFGTRGFLRFEWKPNSFDIVPLVYDPAMHQKTVSDTISIVIERAGENWAMFKNKVDLVSFVEVAASVCVDTAMIFKHPQFEVEGEWRLACRIRLEHGSTNVRYRPSNVGLVPFIAVRPVEMDLPLKSVTIGPCREPNIQKRTITALLFQKQHLGVSVTASDLPVRV